MRAPSLNYSSLSSAVSDKYNAKSGEFANKSIQIATDSARIAKESSQLAKENLERNREFEKKQEALNWANVGIQGLQAVNSWLGAAGKIKEARESANTEQSKDSLLDFSTALDAKIKDSVNAGNTFIDDNGNIVMGDDVKSFYDDYINSTDGTKWNSQVKLNHNYSAKQIFANSESRAASYLQQKYNSEWYAGYQTNLTKAQGIDLGAYSFDQLQSGQVTPEMRYAAGYAVIDSEVSSGKLSAQEAAIHKAQYVRAVDNATGQTVMSQVARQGGDRNAVAEWLKSNYGLTDQEINQINSVADTSEKNYVNNTLIPTAKASMSEALNSYGGDSITTPEQAKAAMEQTLREQGQSEEHIKTVLDAMDEEQYLWNQKRLLTLKGELVDTPQGELVLVRDQLAQDHNAGWFSGSSETLYASTFNSVVDAINDEYKAITAEQKEKFTQIKTYIDGIVSDPDMASGDKIQLIQNMLNDKTGELNMLDYSEDDLYMKQTLNKLVSAKVKAEYQPYAEATIDAICYDFAISKGYGEAKNGKITYSDQKKGLTAADQELAVAKVRGEAQIALGKIIDNAGNMSYAEFTSACDRVKENFMAGLMAAVEESTTFKDSSAQGVLDVLAENADAITIVDNHYELNNSELQSDYEEMAAHENEVLKNDYKIITQGLPVMYEADGEVYPFPVYTDSATGEKIVRTDEGFFKVDENINLAEHPELGKQLEKPIEEKVVIAEKNFEEVVVPHRSSGLSTPTSPDEQKLTDNLKKNINEKSFNHHKNALIDYYVKNKGLSKDEATKTVNEMVSGWRKSK